MRRQYHLFSSNRIALSCMQSCNLDAGFCVADCRGVCICILWPKSQLFARCSLCSNSTRQWNLPQLSKSCLLIMIVRGNTYHHVWLFYNSFCSHYSLLCDLIGRTAKAVHCMIDSVVLLRACSYNVNRTCNLSCTCK